MLDKIYFKDAKRALSDFGRILIDYFLLGTVFNNTITMIKQNSCQPMKSYVRKPIIVNYHGCYHELVFVTPRPRLLNVTRIKTHIMYIRYDNASLTI